MIYLELFWTFFTIGAFTFGGGYAMLPLIQEQVALRWGDVISSEAMVNFIAVSESTPGPFAINMATYIGSQMGGVFGSVCATLGVVLPSFVIILIIAMLLKNLMKYNGVKAFMSGIRPAVVALILATATILLLNNLFGLSTLSGGLSVDLRGIGIFAILIGVAFFAKKVIKKKISPIIMIAFSAVLGMVFYGLF